MPERTGVDVTLLTGGLTAKCSLSGVTPAQTVIDEVVRALQAAFDNEVEQNPEFVTVMVGWERQLTSFEWSICVHYARPVQHEPAWEPPRLIDRISAVFNPQPPRKRYVKDPFEERLEQIARQVISEVEARLQSARVSDAM